MAALYAGVCYIPRGAAYPGDKVNIFRELFEHLGLRWRFRQRQRVPKYFFSQAPRRENVDGQILVADPFPIQEFSHAGLSLQRLRLVVVSAFRLELTLL